MSSGVGKRPTRNSCTSSRDRPGAVGFRVVPGVVDLQEDPLRPPVVVDVGGRRTAPRVVAEPERAQLALHVRDVLLGGDARVRARLHRVLLGRQAERVVAHRVQHVEAVHALEARVHVGGDVAERVADVEPDAARVREHVEHEAGCGRSAMSRGSSVSSPVRFGVQKTCSASQRSCHLCSISLASAAV